MTLIIAAKGDDHIVMGADSRGTTGSEEYRIFTDDHKKIIRLNKYCAVLIAGDSEKGIYLTNQFLLKKKIKEKECVYDVSKKFSEFCREEFKPINSAIRPGSDNYPDVDFIISGLDETGRNPKNPRIFAIRSNSFFSLGEINSYIIEGIPTIANYIFAKRFKREMTVDEKFNLIIECLAETEKYDGRAGGNYNTAVINSYGFDIVDNTKKKNEFLNEPLREIINSD